MTDEQRDQGVGLVHDALMVLLAGMMVFTFIFIGLVVWYVAGQLAWWFRTWNLKRHNKLMMKWWNQEGEE